MQVMARVMDSDSDPMPKNTAEEHVRLLSKIATKRSRPAFEALFEFFGPRIKALMLKSGADHALAEDLVQDVMMTVWRKVDLYSPDRGSVSTWIFTIARNARIDRLRKSSSRPYEDVNDLELPADQADAADELLSVQHTERVAAALTLLPGEQREVIELAYVHDMPQSAIAEKLDLPLGTVKSRMRLAYVKLKTELEDLS